MHKSTAYVPTHITVIVLHGVSIPQGGRYWNPKKSQGSHSDYNVTANALSKITVLDVLAEESMKTRMFLTLYNSTVLSYLNLNNAL